jgi:hypothetical protein
MPEYSPEELLAIEANRRRRVTAAFRLGSQATEDTANPSWLYPLAIGVAITIAIALFLGIGTLAQSASRAPVPVATPSSR